MSLIKKLSFLFLITVAILGVINFTSAQTKVSQEIQIVDALPEIYVKNIQLDKNIYQSGDVVSGKFTLLNESNFPVSDLYYEIALVGGYQENTLAKDYYDSIKLGPVYFQAKESRIIDFTYTIPKTVAGKGLGIQIGALLGTGFRMGWGDAYIEVQGKAGYLLLEEANVVIGEEKFGLQIGPTLHEGEQAVLSVTLKNMTGSSIALNPSIEIYNRANPETVLVKDKLGLATIGTNSLKTFNYNLPRFSDKAGVYVGKVDFVDESGLKRAADIEFRYIMPGEILTIKGLTVDSAVVNKGDTLNVALDYSGPTFDVRDAEDIKNAKFDLEVRLYSEKNELVAEYKNQMDFNQGTRAVFQVVALESAEEIRSEVVAKSGEKIVATYSSIISLIEKGKMINSLTFLVTILALIVLLLIALIRKNKKAAIIVLIIIVIGLFSIYLAEAFTSTNSGRSGVGDSPTIPSISVNSPSGNYTVGQTFYLTGSASATNCSNQYARMLYYYKLNSGDGWINDGSQILTGSNGTRTGQFSMGPFVASDPVGVKKIYLKVEAYAYWGRTKWDQSSFREGYQEYTVVPPAATCSDGIQNQNETGVDCGGVCPACSNGGGGGNSLSASCYGAPGQAIISSTMVNWLATASGTGPFTYLWSGTDGLTGTSSAVNKIYDTIGTKTAQVTVSNSSDTMTINCFSSSGNSGSCTTNCGITATSTINGACGAQLNTCAFGSSPNNYSSNATTNFWTCVSNTPGGTTANCSLAKTENEIAKNCVSLNKTSPTGSPININVNTTWNATFASSSPSGDRVWYLTDENNNEAEIARRSNNVLENYLFNTTGLKTIKVQIGTAVPCTATTTVQQTRDDNNEI